MSTSSVSSWLMNALSAAVIDTNAFTVHPTRAAPSSKANAQCEPTEETLKRGSWSTFEKFHQKEILPEGNEFQSSLFKGFEERQ